MSSSLDEYSYVIRKSPIREIKTEPEDDLSATTRTKPLTRSASMSSPVAQAEALMERVAPTTATKSTSRSFADMQSLLRDGPPSKVKRLPTTTLYFGPTHKPYPFFTATLKEASPVFNKILAKDPKPEMSLVTFEAFDDEMAALLLATHIYGGKLAGPQDWHGLQHYIVLYCQAYAWEMESLCNHVMDLIRHYYRRHDQWAPAFRLEEVYTRTQTPNPLRKFFTQTVAFRYLVGKPADTDVFMSDAIRAVVCKYPELTVDLVENIIKLTRNDLPDPRRGDDCAWHEHLNGHRCVVVKQEPWEQ